MMNAASFPTPNNPAELPALSQSSPMQQEIP
jgi:hypothetical protein